MPRKIRRQKPVKQNCYFCGQKTDPVFSDTAMLSKYVTDRGKIIGRARSGVCAKHQRKLSLAIKYARHIALLPFVYRG